MFVTHEDQHQIFAACVQHQLIWIADTTHLFFFMRKLLSFFLFSLLLLTVGKPAAVALEAFDLEVLLPKPRLELELRSLSSGQLSLKVGVCKTRSEDLGSLLAFCR